MSDLAAIAAQLVDVRNVGQHKCVKLTLHVPAEQAEQVMEAFGWPTMVDPVPVAVARLVQPAERTVVPDNKTGTPSDTRPALESLPAPVRAKVSSEKRLAQLAGMLAKDPLFIRYMIEVIGFHDRINEEDAADCIRIKCDVISRSKILPNTPAAAKFLKLYDDFARWRDADQYVEAS